KDDIFVEPLSDAPGPCELAPELTAILDDSDSKVRRHVFDDCVSEMRRVMTPVDAAEPPFRFKERELVRDLLVRRHCGQRYCRSEAGGRGSERPTRRSDCNSGSDAAPLAEDCGNTLRDALVV